MSKMSCLLLAPLLLSLNINATDKVLNHSNCNTFVFKKNVEMYKFEDILKEKNYQFTVVNDNKDMAPDSLYLEVEHRLHKILSNSTMVRIYRTQLNSHNEISFDNIMSIKLKKNGKLSTILKQLIPQCNIAIDSIPGEVVNQQLKLKNSHGYIIDSSDEAMNENE